MKYKLICCEVLMREACRIIADCPHTIDPEFTPKGAHEDSAKLHEIIKTAVYNASKKGEYDAILLGFGLCGNALLDICSDNIPLVIPRAHDCCTIFLGSKQSYKQYFGDNPSAEWSSAGYMERGDSYIREGAVGKMMGLDKTYEKMQAEYGSENADFIWQTLHPQNHCSEVIYINIPGTVCLGYLEKFKVLADEKNSEVKVIEGDMRLLRGLLYGEWNRKVYLVVPPRKKIKGIYDFNEIISI
jgi:hypothetical protein